MKITDILKICNTVCNYNPVDGCWNYKSSIYDIEVRFVDQDHLRILIKKYGHMIYFNTLENKYTSEEIQYKIAEGITKSQLDGTENWARENIDNKVVDKKPEITSLIYLVKKDNI